MSANTVTPRVRRKIDKLFDPQSASEIMRLLESASLPLINNNGERVHLAVLHLSQGDREKFDEALKIAQIDWRDTLVAAGLANGNWPEVLRERGD